MVLRSTNCFTVGPEKSGFGRFFRLGIFFFGNRLINPILRGWVKDMAENTVPIWTRRTAALLRCTSLAWLATRRSARLAPHPVNSPKNLNGIYRHVLTTFPLEIR